LDFHQVTVPYGRWIHGRKPAKYRITGRKKMKRRLMVAVGAFIAMSCALAYAEMATLDIDFAFDAGAKAFPAGKYTVEIVNPDTITLAGQAGRVIMPSITRLAQRANDSDVALVFDKVGDRYLLSEVWFPGKDGFLVLSTAEAHGHRVMGGKAHPMK
jgi:hypothetical protein